MLQVACMMRTTLHRRWAGRPTFEPLMSINTKLGCALGFRLLKAPVPEPGLMRMRSSCCMACTTAQTGSHISADMCIRGVQGLNNRMHCPLHVWQSLSIIRGAHGLFQSDPEQASEFMQCFAGCCIVAALSGLVAPLSFNCPFSTKEWKNIQDCTQLQLLPQPQENQKGRY